MKGSYIFNFFLGDAGSICKRGKTLSKFTIHRMYLKYFDPLTKKKTVYQHAINAVVCGRIVCSPPKIKKTNYSSGKCIQRELVDDETVN